MEFALERRLADVAVALVANGVRPWSQRCREVAAGWPAVDDLEFRGVPDGCSVGCGSVIRSGGRAIMLPHRDEFVLPWTEVQQSDVARVIIAPCTTSLG